MVNLSALQSKINTKIFDALGSTILLAARTEGSNDKWGDRSDSFGTPASTVAVPWLHIKNAQDFQPFGDLELGQVDMAFKYDQSLGIGDYAKLNSQEYKIIEVEQFPLKDGVLVQVARLAESIT